MNSKGKATGTLLGMAGVVTVAWLLILGATYAFFVIVRPLGPALHGSPLPSSILKIVLTLGLGASWFIVMFALSWLYVRAYRTPNEPSYRRTPSS